MRPPWKILSVVIFTTLTLLSSTFAQLPPSAFSTQTNNFLFPVNSTPVTATGTGTTGAVAATLAAVANKVTFICGFVITGGGTTSALVQNATVAGTVSGTMNFTYVDVSSGQGLLGIAFPQCIPGSAVNTAIVVTAPAGGTGTVKAVSVWGFQL